MSGADFKAATRRRSPRALSGALKAAGYPAKADPAQINYPMVLLLLFILVLYVTMVYGPIAAWLVELFPARIRYTSMSLPYHIGNGWFGGFLPTVAFALVALTGRHLLRPVVPDHRGADDARHRSLLPARDQGSADPLAAYCRDPRDRRSPANSKRHTAGVSKYGRCKRRKRRGWSWWYLLFVLQFVAVLWPPFYNKVEPTWMGMPFFYWFQLLWVIVSAVFTASSISPPTGTSAEPTIDSRGSCMQDSELGCADAFSCCCSASLPGWGSPPPAGARAISISCMSGASAAGASAPLITWFLVGGDLYTAYTFIAVPALAFGAGARRVLRGALHRSSSTRSCSWCFRAFGTCATSTATSPRAISCAAASATAGWRWR